jgi:microcystin-dependent protein
VKTKLYINMNINTRHRNWLASLGIAIIFLTRAASAQTTGLVERVGILETNMLRLSEELDATKKQVVPPGTIVAFGGGTNTIPAGWFLCDGKQVERDRYPRLFVAISTAWGHGNGSSTFNLPDLRGFFLRGVSGSSPRDPDQTSRNAVNSGGNTGNAVGTWQPDQVKEHRHTETRYVDAGREPRRATKTGDEVGSLETVDTGASGGKETRPINASVHYIIKY